MLGTAICFDAGTNTMAVYVRGKGLVASEPSVVAYDAQTGKISAIGKRAYEMTGRNPDWVDVIRPVKEGSVYNFQTMQSVLSYYVQKACKNKVLKPNILICMPSDANSVDKRTVLDLATSAGAAKACIIDETLAAAIGAGVDVNSYKGTMVVDIGGGTTDIAVIARGMVCVSKSLKIAGNTFDDAIINYLKKEKDIVIGKIMAESIKKNIGCTKILEAELAVRAAGKDFVTNLPKSVEVTSSDVFISIREQLETIAEGIRSVLENTPPELNADVSRTGIIVTGGSAMLTGIEHFIENRTGIKTIVADDPQNCVIKGMGKVLKASKLLERNGYYYKTRQELVGYEE